MRVPFHLTSNLKPNSDPRPIPKSNLKGP